VGLFPFSMPRKLKRYYGRGDLHFITFSCYRRCAFLATARSRHAFVEALQEVRTRYGFFLVGYVVMPEHVHLLVSEPKIGTPSTIVHSLKLRVSKRLRLREFPQFTEAPQFWQRRFYDFNVYCPEKRREKLEYIHRNPVTRGLVQDPKDWPWSSYASYSCKGLPLIPIDFVD
jgi:putative transposase